MIKTLTCLALAATAAAGPLLPAPARANPHIGACLDAEADAERLAAACRSALQAGGLDRRQTAAAYTNSGIALSELGRDGDAISAYDRAVAADPAFTPAYANRALSRARRGRTEEAIADWTEVIRRDPRDWEARLGRAGLQLTAGRPAQALEDAEAGIRLARRAPDLHYTKGLALAALDRPREAVAAFDAALRLAPDDADAWMQRGLLQRGPAPAEALRDMSRAIELSPRRAAFYAYRGEVLEEMGRLADANRDYRRAFELGLQSPWLNQKIEAMGG